MTPIPGVKNFCVEELVDKAIFDQFGERSIWFLDCAMVMCLDRLSADIGPIIVNNWHNGGAFHESGLRRFNTPTGAAMSQHKFGCAFDLKPQKIGVAQLYQHITGNHFKYPQITTIEDPTLTKTWLHVDSRWHEGDAILIVKP